MLAAPRNRAAAPEIVFLEIIIRGISPEGAGYFPPEGGAISRRSRLRTFMLAAPRNKAAAPEIV